jgi:hypothetical protein
MICLSAGCQNSKLKIIGSSKMPDGIYVLAITDDPNISMVRDSTGERTLGYLATNDHSKAVKYVQTIADATAFEHKGDTARKVGKAALYTLLIVGVVALVAAGGYEAARANQAANTVTTTCQTFATTTTCTSR